MKLIKPGPPECPEPTWMTPADRMGWKENLIPKRKPPSLLDKDFHYTPSNSTDVGKTFARHGFVPPSTLKRKTAP